MIGRELVSPDGVRLAVYERGDPGANTIVALHGYPDDHTVWNAVSEQLADRYRVVSYDVRGAGASGKPAAVRDYHLDRLVDDLRLVLDTVSPAEPVHLVGHDWGAIQGWAALTEPRLQGRIASFTSISGPEPQQFRHWLRAHPVAGLAQLRRSLYISALRRRGIGEVLVRSGLIDRRIARHERRSGSRKTASPARIRGDELTGLSLYRANLGGRGNHTAPRRIEIPVQVIVATRDRYVSPACAVGAPRPWVDQLTVHAVEGGHWLPTARPQRVARLIAEFIEVPTAPRKPRSGTFAGALVVVTGAGRGIGRATALEFSRQGAEVVAADIDDGAAQATVEAIRRAGGVGWARQLDVSETAAWERFAAELHDEHGVADILVNNAGIGMGGPLLHTGVEDWERVLRVNLWGVIHGCRLIATQQVERGQGGHIVNVASAAAFAPSVMYPAYATTKAAVVALSDGLRAELAGEGIDVTAVCPGFIDTDISRTTIHVGVDELTAARKRERMAAAYRRRGYSPERVARALVTAVTRRRPLALITPEAKAAYLLSRLAPPLTRRLARIQPR